MGTKLNAIILDGEVYVPVEQRRCCDGCALEDDNLCNGACNVWGGVIMRHSPELTEKLKGV